MKQLFEPLTIRNHTINNRICVPPMVCFNWADSSGLVSDRHVAHYKAMAAGKPGLIIQEATCVTEDGKLHDTQLGIWSDSHVPGLRRIAEAVHSHGVPIVMQIHHAGVVGIAEHPLCPDSFQYKPEVVGKKMTGEDLDRVRDGFIQAARRACEAGYDGVELHGCHRYLLCQFLNSDVNKREDLYGRKREQFVLEILEGIRGVVPEEFIVGIRLGAFEPTLEDGLRHAAVLEQHGIDFLDISYGFVYAPDRPLPGWNEAYPYRDIVYAAGIFAGQCSVPVFAVNGIRTPSDAKWVLEDTDVDMVDIGRSFLVDYDWAAKAARGDEPGKCLDCKVCQWRIDPDQCAGKLLMARRAAR